MDPSLQSLGAELGDIALRNAASAVTGKIRALKARKQDQETIAELEEIINGLLADKSELMRIARAYEQEFVSQRISQEDIEYISERLIPLLQMLIASSTSNKGTSTSSDEIIDLVTSLLSVEVVTVLQLLGFNFKKAIGEPLTDLVAQLITSKSPGLAGAQARQRPSSGQHRKKR